MSVLSGTVTDDHQGIVFQPECTTEKKRTHRRKDNLRQAVRQQRAHPEPLLVYPGANRLENLDIDTVGDPQGTRQRCIICREFRQRIDNGRYVIGVTKTGMVKDHGKFQ